MCVFDNTKQWLLSHCPLSSLAEVPELSVTVRWLEWHSMGDALSIWLHSRTPWQRYSWPLLRLDFSRVQQFGKRTRISSTPLRSHFIYFRVVLLLLLNWIRPKPWRSLEPRKFWLLLQPWIEGVIITIRLCVWLGFCLQFVITVFTKPSGMEASSWRVLFDIQEKDILGLLIAWRTNYSVERVAG